MEGDAIKYPGYSDHAFKPRAWEAEAGVSLVSLKPAWPT